MTFRNSVITLFMVDISLVTRSSDGNLTFHAVALMALMATLTADFPTVLVFSMSELMECSCYDLH